MKRLLLALGALLMSTSAMAGGIYTDASAVSSATGNPNVAVTLWTQNIAGGAISANNAMRIHVRATEYGDYGVSGSLQVKYGSQVLAYVTLAGQGDAILDITVTRTGNNYGTVVGTLAYPAMGYPMTFSDSFYGTFWTSQNAVSIVGISNQFGGTILQEVGIER